MRKPQIVPGKLQARTQDFYNLVAYISTDPVAMYGLPMTIICTIVIMFVFLGQLLLKSGASEWFTDIASALMFFLTDASRDVTGQTLIVDGGVAALLPHTRT